MMLAFRKLKFPWKNLTTKPILYASGSFLTLLTLLTVSEFDRLQQLAIGTGFTSAIASLVILGNENYQFKKRKEQVEQELKENEEKLDYLQQLLQSQKQIHQERETSLTQENQELVQIKKNLEQEISQLQLTLQQEKQSYCNLQKDYQQMEEFLTETNDELVQSKDAIEKQFQQQENQYCQEIERLEHTNQQLKQYRIQLEEEIKQLTEENQSCKPANKSDQSLNECNPFNQVKVALIGGHPKACERVRNQLENEYGFKQCQIIPNDNHEIDLGKIESTVKDADQVFMVTSYNNNSLRNQLNRLKKAGHLKRTIRSISCSGSDGIVREILAQISA